MGRCFLGERERAGEEEMSEGPGGAPSHLGGVATPPGASQVSLCPIFDVKIYKEFSGIFRETLFSRIFQKFAY
jgi:hypothetical protein